MEKPMKWTNIRAVTSRVIAVGVLLLVYPAVGAMSAELSSIPSGALACEGSVYTVDPDPKGTNVRSAPHKKSPVLIVIPDDPEATVVDLSASFEDWVLIHSAQGVTSGFWFEGEGWVHASLLAVRAVHPTGRKVPLYSKPDIGSSVIKMFTVETEARLAGCKGHWMQVRIGNQKGWLAPGDYCGNPVTTCP
jgi:SH3-like domain-containing protein